MLTGTIVFAGDSVTDCGHREDPDHLGNGYVRLLAGDELLSGMHIVNAGTGGDRLEDLAVRWDRDVVAMQPAVVSLMIGINDTWRQFDTGQCSGIEAFTTRYRRLLSSLDPATRIILMEPFVVPLDHAQEQWRADVDRRIDAVHGLAEEFGATIVPTDEVLNLASATREAETLAADGVHPTALGHREIATAWLRAVRP